ncbi:MAG: plasmid pRiA4b ORF-3 family protein [Bacteroidales bacterium]|nr:plasmid pRiA4b ORF-3 family protein [Bacteroidales bacterium]
MYYYKFKVYYDEVEDFVRDIEILANDNFESLHKLLYECIGLKGNEFAAFSICDPKWNKQKEITLMDTSDEDDMEEPEYDESDSFSTKSRLPKFVMKDSLLKNFITDPHQHILYEYDFMNPKIFYLELQKTLQTDSAEGFPRCTFKSMELPVQLNVSNVPNPEDPELEDLDDLEEEEDDLFGDEGFNDDDFGDLNEYSEY